MLVLVLMVGGLDRVMAFRLVFSSSSIRCRSSSSSIRLSMVGDVKPEKDFKKGSGLMKKMLLKKKQKEETAEVTVTVAKVKVTETETGKGDEKVAKKVTKTKALKIDEPISTDESKPIVKKTKTKTATKTATATATAAEIDEEVHVPTPSRASTTPAPTPTPTPTPTPPATPTYELDDLESFMEEGSKFIDDAGSKFSEPPQSEVSCYPEITT